MKLPFSFHKKEKDLSEDKQIELIDKLIEASQSSKKGIDKRIDYLIVLKDNITITNRAQAKYKQIIEFLINQTTEDITAQDKLNEIIRSQESL